MSDLAAWPGSCNSNSAVLKGAGVGHVLQRCSAEDGAAVVRFAIAQKSGVMFTHLLFNHLVTGCTACPLWGGDVRLLEWRLPRRAPAATHPLTFLLVRNPYTRFLSAFLDKGLTCTEHNGLLSYRTWAPISSREKPMRVPPQSDFRGSSAELGERFRDVLKCLHSRFEKLGRSWRKRELLGARSGTYLIEDDHFWPQVTLYGQLSRCDERYCPGTHAKPPHHRNRTSRVSPVGGAMPRRARWSPPKEVEVLRQEEQASWWRCFTDALGIPWSSLAHGWKGVRSPSISIRSDCYWLPKGGSANVTCASFYASSPTSRKDANTLPHRRLQASEFTKGHSTKASSSLRHFYDAASAAIVYQLYLDDFQSFGYPRWDGVSEFVPILQLPGRESQRPRHAKRFGRRASCIH